MRYPSPRTTSAERPSAEPTKRPLEPEHVIACLKDVNAYLASHGHKLVCRPDMLGCDREHIEDILIQDLSYAKIEEEKAEKKGDRSILDKLRDRTRELRKMIYAASYPLSEEIRPDAGELVIAESTIRDSYMRQASWQDPEVEKELEKELQALELIREAIKSRLAGDDAARAALAAEEFAHSAWYLKVRKNQNRQDVIEARRHYPSLRAIRNRLYFQWLYPDIFRAI